MFRFAHMADCHVGGWSDPKMKDLSIEAFRQAVETCISRKVDFVLISGDLFNTAIPQIDMIRDVAAGLRQLKDASMPVYIIAGSHDFSPSGKTMLDVLEKAGLCENVVKFRGNVIDVTVDRKTGVKIAGMLGRKGGMEKLDYESMDFSGIENEPGFKVFMFHTAIEEFKPASMGDMEAQSVASLPRNFSYYAGGHVHYIFDTKHGEGLLAFPGALFPNNFKEIEEFRHGGFYIVDDALNFEYVPVKLKNVESWCFDAEGKSPDDVASEIRERIRVSDIKDRIVTVRVAGTLSSGKPSDIKFKEIFSMMGDAYFVMKNTGKLFAREFEELGTRQGSVEEIEQSLLKEHSENSEVKGLPVKSPEMLVGQLMLVLDKEKAEGEKTGDFERRVVSESSGMLGIDI